MSQAYSGGATVLVDTVIDRWRELPVLGELSVGIGDFVNPDTMIGFASITGDGYVVRVAEGLGLNPEEAMRCLSVKAGDSVTKGDILAVHKVFFGLFKAEVKSPVSGVVELISEITGTVLIRAAPKKITRSAFLGGRVSDLVDKSAVKITSACTVIQGVFGVGGERYGTIRVLDQLGEVSSFEPSNIDKGAIIISSGPPTIEAINQGVERGISGWIAGSIDDTVMEKFAGRQIGVAITGDEAVPFTLFITEGFGRISMSKLALNAFSLNNGKFASITGVTQVRAGAIRPEAIISREDRIKNLHCDHEKKLSGMIIGKEVRLIRHPFFGMVGSIKELPAEPREIATGAFARIAVVELDNNSTVEVPRANIELLD